MPRPAMQAFQALWDTGATQSAITRNVVGPCDLMHTTFRDVHHAGGLARNVPVYLVNIGLPNRVQFAGVEVTEMSLPEGIDVVIGMDIITRGDFAVTNLDGKTTFSFRIPSRSRIDFVAEDDTEALKARVSQKQSRPAESTRQVNRRRRRKRGK